MSPGLTWWPLTPLGRSGRPNHVTTPFSLLNMWNQGHGHIRSTCMRLIHITKWWWRKLSKSLHSSRFYGMAYIFIALNSLRPGDAYMRQKTNPSLVQIMACRLVGAKPLSAPILEYCWLDPWQHTSVKSPSICIHFHKRKYISKRGLDNGGHFVLALMC